MNKKLNTFYFIIIATIFNVFIMLTLLIGGIIIISKISNAFSPSLYQFLLIPVILISIFGTLLIHHKLINFISKRIDMNKYFTPLFGYSKKKQDDNKK